jgi:signal transduction histidine kinase
MNEKPIDQRINARYPLWVECCILIFGVLCCLGWQIFIYFYLKSVGLAITSDFVLKSVIYWLLLLSGYGVATLLVLRRMIDRPMQILAEAMRQVAKGDLGVHLAPLRKDGRKDYVEIAFEDFNTMVSELSSVETLAGNVIAGISHEIKTPLAVIQSYTQALRNEEISQTMRRDYAETVVAATERLNLLVRNIMRLSKLENEKLTPQKEEFNLSRQLADCILSYETLLHDKRLSLSVEMEDMVMITANAVMLELIWTNLLSNAIKFTAPGGGIAVQLESKSDEVVVTIKDSGCGMDNDTMRHIFDKFYQADASRSAEGDGLGLSLVKRALELAGGRIDVQSLEGIGSSFAIHLPKK